ncbi:MAG TPA: YbaK/EbsC family protein [Ktedonobacterales bacterium]|jgi:prolyl-tRNA editing enzyme YbaK/EbsC (Cys-tRNA(Pro) deacylase)
MKASVQRVADALKEQGIQAEIIEFAESTRTAEEAAAAVNSTLGQIVKSLVFIAGERPVLALVSGTNRVDTDKLAAMAGGPIKRANADIVREATGFSIGGVPPVGHSTPLRTYLDRDLLQYELVWAAAGTPNAVFPITPDELQRITGARVAELAAAG